MKIYYKKMFEDLKNGLKSMAKALVVMIAALILLIISPVALPLSYVIFVFQENYTDTEPNKYLKTYLAIWFAIILAKDIT